VQSTIELGLAIARLTIWYSPQERFGDFIHHLVQSTRGFWGLYPPLGTVHKRGLGTLSTIWYSPQEGSGDFIHHMVQSTREVWGLYPPFGTVQKRGFGSLSLTCCPSFLNRLCFFFPQKFCYLILGLLNPRKLLTCIHPDISYFA
jgi:hypothetical protein